MRFVQVVTFALAAALGGLIAAGTSLDTIAPPGGEHVYWHVGRASGFAAFGLLFFSVVLGLAVSSRVFDGLIVRPWVFEMHQFLSLYVLIAIVFHALVMLPDPYAGFRLTDMLVPFASPYRPISVGVGAIVLYGSAIVSLSYYVKKIIGQQAWRWLHYTTFLLFLGALGHGVYAGTDTREPWAQGVYLSTGFAVLFLTFFRILASRQAARADRAKAPRPLPAATPAREIAA
jgi:predicted ferric reductase